MLPLVCLSVVYVFKQEFAELALWHYILTVKATNCVVTAYSIPVIRNAGIF